MQKKYFIELPSYKNKEIWDENQTFVPKRVLTPKGITCVKSLLRNEQKDILDTSYIFIGVLIGFIGSITGLHAIILK